MDQKHLSLYHEWNRHRYISDELGAHSSGWYESHPLEKCAMMNLEFGWTPTVTLPSSDQVHLLHMYVRVLFMSEFPDLRHIVKIRDFYPYSRFQSDLYAHRMMTIPVRLATLQIFRSHYIPWSSLAIITLEDFLSSTTRTSTLYGHSSDQNVTIPVTTLQMFHFQSIPDTLQMLVVNT